VVTVRDFAVVFDACAAFLEGVAAAAMEAEPSAEEIAEDRDAEIGLVLARLEDLTERRPLLMSSVLLRQNPHNVHEWHKRARIFLDREDLAGAVEVFTSAVASVQPWKASNGRPHTLWLAFAKLYEDHDDLESARSVFNKAVSTPEKFRGPDDLAAVWCEFAEMELRTGTPEAPALAIKVLERATARPKNDGGKDRPAKRLRAGKPAGDAEVVLGAGDGNAAISWDYEADRGSARACWRSPRVWGMLADLQMSVGSVADAIRVYDAMMDYKVVTVEMVMNAGRHLEKKRHFEDAFRIYERAVATFPWPAVLAVWTVYLDRFVSRFGGKKLERARDLFEEALQKVPQGDRNARILYLMYADLEEKHGLPKKAMGILARAAEAVPDDERASMYKLYISKASQLFGVTRTREIFEKAIMTAVDTATSVGFSQRFAELETRLGEIDRARAIYAHGAQAADPGTGGRAADEYWRAWGDFELAHGSEETYAEMLRVKRSVQMKFSRAHLTTGAAASRGTIEQQAAAGSGGAGIHGVVGMAEQSRGAVDIAAMERQAEVLMADGAAVGGASGEGMEAGAAQAANEEEIDIGMDDDDDDDNEDVAATGGDQEAAFGGIKVVGIEGAAAPAEDADEPVGALAKLKRKRAQA